jgi:hypothetical protein
MDVQITVGQWLPNVQMPGLREWGQSGPTGVYKEFRCGYNSCHRGPLVIDEIDLNSRHLFRSISKMLRLYFRPAGISNRHLKIN